MRIGVDIDAVLNYSPKIMLECGTKYCAETGRGELIDPGAHDLKKKFSWDQEVRDDFWYRYAWEQMWVRPAQAYASEVIKKLKSEGHEIWITTGRSNHDARVQGMPEDETWEEVTRAWLKKNDVVYDRLCFDVQDKGGFCRAENVELMIEDNMHFLVTFDEHTRVLIFDYPYNREIDLPNAVRVYSWYDIYNKIREM